mmetsp:Transcript_9011/g.28481  ORF Transcript_9011/g.28481 Transcript_9011/m.28481 type:complete len:116 (+) Transcript_9011:52-399(+)
MRTARDVIKRIQWDPELELDAFVIGYLDRFRGIIEADIGTFLSSDVPEHRIAFVRFHDEVVWCKADRLDNVFGSTEGGCKIQEVVSAWQEAQAAEGADGGAVAAAEAGALQVGAA